MISYHVIPTALQKRKKNLWREQKRLMVAMARARVIRMIRLGTKESSGQQK